MNASDTSTLPARRHAAARGGGPLRGADPGTTGAGHAALPPPAILIPEEFALLEQELAAIRRRPGERHERLARLIAARLAGARMLPPDAVPPDVATGGSRVLFAVDDGPLEERVLVHRDGGSRSGIALPVASFLGATLLGMAAGQGAPLQRAEGPPGQVVLHRVAFQPEAAALARAGWQRLAEKGG